MSAASGAQTGAKALVGDDVVFARRLGEHAQLVFSIDRAGGIARVSRA